MRSRLIFLAISIGVIVLGLVVIQSIPKKKAKETKKEESIIEATPPARELLKKAKNLISQGNFKKAREICREVIDKYPQDIKYTREALRLWEDLNIKILFSPRVDEFSTLYKVKPGDTLSEIAKKFGTTVSLIKKSNRLKSDIIRPGQSLKVVNKKFNILIDTSQNILMLKVDDKVIKTYTVSTGKNNSTPLGSFRIINRIPNPVWYRQDIGAVVPPDSPENILGKYWLGLSIKGYGIHGTNDGNEIGKYVTQGCIRMRAKDIEELFTILPLGTEVVIID